MNKERFEKVVKWKEEPNYVVVVFGIILLINFISLIIKYPNPPLIILFVGACCFVIGWILLACSTGRGRKVYLEKIK